MTCPTCELSRPVEIDMTLGQSRVTLHACSSCESKWWDREGERLELRTVLALVPSRA